MDNPEKLATQGTQDEDKQNKTTNHYVPDTIFRYCLWKIHSS